MYIATSNKHLKLSDGDRERIAEMERGIDATQTILMEREGDLHRFLLERFDVKPGDIITSGSDTFKVDCVTDVGWGHVRGFKRNKDGKFSHMARRVYGDWVKANQQETKDGK